MSDRSVGCSSSDYQFPTGPAGTRLEYDADNGEIWVYNGSTKVLRLSTAALVVPDAPSNLNSVPAGGFCYDASTGNIYYRGNLTQI